MFCNSSQETQKCWKLFEEMSPPSSEFPRCLLIPSWHRSQAGCSLKAMNHMEIGTSQPWPVGPPRPPQTPQTHQKNSKAPSPHKSLNKINGLRGHTRKSPKSFSLLPQIEQKSKPQTQNSSQIRGEKIEDSRLSSPSPASHPSVSSPTSARDRL